MSISPASLEIQGNFMRVPPPKEQTKSLERRRSSDETLKPMVRRSMATACSSSTNVSSQRKTVPVNQTKTENRSTMNRPDETEQLKKKIVHLDDEIRRLKRRIDELEKDIGELQKQIRTKDKRIVELTKENDELKMRVSTCRICSACVLVIFVS
jgi:chromosome segregation ATPase